MRKYKAKNLAKKKLIDNDEPLGEIKVNENLWIPIRNFDLRDENEVGSVTNLQGREIKESDIVKLGRVRFRVKEVCL